MSEPRLESPYCIRPSWLRKLVLRTNEKWLGRLQGRLFTPEAPEVQEVVVSAPRIRHELRIAHLSDLHAATWTSNAYVNRCVEACMEMQAQLVLWTGDFMLRSVRELRRVLRRFVPLHRHCPTFGVLGNHDTYGDVMEVARVIEASGVRLLRNCGAEVVIGKVSIALRGIDDLYNGGDIRRAFEQALSGDWTLLLSHRSDVLWHLSDHAVDLVLAGHLHGGQVRFPGGRALYLPAHSGRRMIEEPLAEHEGRQVHVTRGLGYTGFPVRIGAPSSISLIRLVPSALPTGPFPSGSGS